MQIRQLFRGLVALVLCVQLVGVGMVPPAHAGMIRTDEYAASAEREAQLARVQDFMAEARVQAQFEALGVDAEQAAERVASLTDAELAQLDADLSDMPAGASSALTVVGVVFVVLLILELLGITNVFVAI